MLPLLPLLLLWPAAVAALSLPSASLDIILRVRITNLNPASMQRWLMQRPFAAVLPMQPMLVMPLEPPEHGATVTFRRKPNSEKGGQDGGLRFSVAMEGEEQDVEGEGPDGVTEVDACEGAGVLLVSRISEGQYTNKPFSERAICRSIKKDLASLPAEVGVVGSVIDYLEDRQRQQRREREDGIGDGGLF